MLELILPVLSIVAILIFCFLTDSAKLSITAVAISLFLFVLWGSQLMGLPRLDKFTYIEGPITVLAFKAIENEAIYIWADGKEPISYSLPWSEEDANKLKQIEKSIRLGEAKGIRMTIKRDTLSSEDKERFQAIVDSQEMRKD